MPIKCAVVNCSVANAPFRIPKIVTNQGEEAQALSERRRRAWLRQIHRKEITSDNVKPHHRICARHFIKGSPAATWDQNNPDWIPTLHMGHDMTQPVDVDRYTRVLSRRKNLTDQLPSTKASSTRISEEIGPEPSETLLLDRVSQPKETEFKTIPHCEEWVPLSSTLDYGKNLNLPARQEDSLATVLSSAPTLVTTATQTDMTAEYINTLEEVVNDLNYDYVKKKEEVRRVMTNQPFFEENFQDTEKVQAYTGLPNAHFLFGLLNLISDQLPGSKSSLSKFQQLLLFMMKLRLNLPLLVLADLFQVCLSTASSTFNKTLDILFASTKSFVHWPDREALYATMPLEFQKQFGKKCTVIIDCFEIFLERPSSLLARAQTWSNYKQHNTIKYLIGIAPQGVVTFVSEGWGGRTSDKYVTEHSGFLDKLLPGDIVLADRGFKIADSVNLMCADLKIPAFTKGKSQLSPLDVETTRKIAHLRIHVERVIGLLRQKYPIFSSTVPITFVKSAHENATITLDKMVHVGCGLINICQSVVPFD